MHGDTSIGKGQTLPRGKRGSRLVADSIGYVDESGCGRSSSSRSGRRFERSSTRWDGSGCVFVFRREMLPKVG